MNDAATKCRRKFLKFFPEGFKDAKYIAWERGYKCHAHQQWTSDLHHDEHRALLIEGQYVEIAERAVRIESRTNLLFSFEKMGLRDAVKSIAGAALFARGLYDWLYGAESEETKFTQWCAVVQKLPRKKSRVFTWPVLTVFGFIAMPERHIFLKPTVTRVAATEYGYAFDYQPTPCWSTYASLLELATVVRKDLTDLHPADMIDVQSFLWVQGSDEYKTAGKHTKSSE